MQRPPDHAGSLDASHYKAQQDARQGARERAWAQYARDVARLKNASKQRWAAVRLVAKGQIAGKLWALNARLTDQRAWRRLHERHRAALQAADQNHRPLEWGTWVRASASADEHAPQHVALPVTRALNAVTAAGAATRGWPNATVATDAAVHRVPGGTIRDDGERLTLLEGTSQEALAALLRLARTQYGPRLGVDGDEVFRERLVQVAAASALDITFADPQLEARRHQLQRQHRRNERSTYNARPRSDAARTRALHEQNSTRQRKGRSR